MTDHDAPTDYANTKEAVTGSVTPMRRGRRHRRQLVARASDYFEGERFSAMYLAEAIQAEATVRPGLDGRLYRFDGTVWREDGDAFVAERARALLGEYWTSHYARETVRWFQAEPVLFTDDLPTGTLNLLNGVLDWKTRTLAPHTPDAVMSPIQIPHEWDEWAMCPAIDRFLAEVLPPDCIDFFWEWLGLLLVPLTQFEKMLIPHGPPGTGKSKVCSLATHLVGAINCASESLHNLAHEKWAPAELFGKLANINADLDISGLTSSEMLKKIISGDQLSAQRKYGQKFTFWNRARLMFACNSVVMTVESEALADRIWVLPMDKRFRGTGEEDRDLERKLTTEAELQGALVNAVDGLSRLMARGHFIVPSSVAEATTRYVQAMDPLRQFIDEECLLGDHLSARCSLVWDRYSKHTSARFVGPKSAFRDRLSREYGVSVRRSHPSGAEMFHGIALREP